MWLLRAVAIDPVAVHDPEPGSYSSEEDSGEPPAVLEPPATSTLPFGRSVAVGMSRPVASEPVVVQVPAAGSYSSAEDTLGGGSGPPLLAGQPPATSTLPFGSSVAV